MLASLATKWTEEILDMEERGERKEENNVEITYKVVGIKIT